MISLANTSRNRWIQLCTSFLTMIFIWMLIQACSPIGPDNKICKTDLDCGGALRCIKGRCAQTSYTSEEHKITKERASEKNQEASIAQEPTQDAQDAAPDQAIADKKPDPLDRKPVDTPETKPTECTPGQTRACYTGPKDRHNKGACTEGKQICTAAGIWPSQCAGEVKPSSEICDGKDNDCDGQIDNSFIEKDQSCVVQHLKGECQTGKYTACNKGSKVCTSIVAPKAELCGNGKDDNCDGSVDENPPCSCKNGETRECYTGPSSTKNVGVCKPGKQECKNFTWQTCQGQILSSKEICDGKDNDCNGKTDESFPEKGLTCKNPKALGECLVGTYTKCQNGQKICESIKKPIQEICENKKDDDCDGKIDENPPCVCKTNETRECYTGKSGTKGVGICSPGKQICKLGVWGTCQSQILPKTETCNGKDDNCDGKVDEYDIRLNRKCSVSGALGPCRIGATKCIRGTIKCNSNFTQRAEICRNGVDDDCDGKVDEICGSAHTYVRVSSTGKMVVERNIASVTRTATGSYSIQPKNRSEYCKSKPIFVTLHSGAVQATSYICDKDAFKINIAKENSTALPSPQKDTPFNAVIPMAVGTTTYGVVQCYVTGAGWNCKSSASYGSPTVKRISAGIYEIRHRACKSKYQPVFTNIVGSYTVGYSHGYFHQNGVCRVHVLNLFGKPFNNAFAFWIPDPAHTAYATISSKGAIVQQNTFGNDVNAKWTHTSVYKTSTRTYLYNRIHYTGYSNKTAVFTKVLTGSDQVATVYSYRSEQRVMTHDIGSKRKVPALFTVMFVQ